MYVVSERPDICTGLGLIVRLLHADVLEWAVPVWQLLLLVRCWTLPVVFDPQPHELSVLSGWERGHIGSVYVHLVCGWKIRSLRPHLMYIVRKWPDIRSRLGLVI
eukprot:COSAG04_NODE_14637_length_560_cov_2.477223_1_plen_104_part_10